MRTHCLQIIRSAAGLAAKMIFSIMMILATYSFALGPASAISAEKPGSYSNNSIPESLHGFSFEALKKISQQNEYAHWKHASLTFYPLGPGTHGWFAVVSKGNKDVGYLIISAKEEGGYMLSEYGHDS